MKNRLQMILMLACVLVCTASIQAQTYNIYFGDIHTQTWYSDGNQDQNEATYTKPVARAIETLMVDEQGNYAVHLEVIYSRHPGVFEAKFLELLRLKAAKMKARPFHSQPAKPEKLAFIPIEEPTYSDSARGLLVPAENPDVRIDGIEV